MEVSPAKGVMMTGDAWSTLRSATLKRLERAALCRRSTRVEKTRCEVAEPMSMPTLRSTRRSALNSECACSSMISLPSAS